MRASNLLKLTTLTAASMALVGTAHAKIETGSNVADMAVVDSNGITHNLADFAGKTVVLEWTNHGCPYVVKHYNPSHEGGNMQNLQKAAAKDDIVWLTVISSAPGKQGYVDGQGANALTETRSANPSAVVLDASGDLGRTFSAKTTPHMYIIDPSQTLVYQGAIDSKKSTNPADISGATNYVTEALTALKTGQPIAEAETKPYGCSVKY